MMGATLLALLVFGGLAWVTRAGAMPAREHPDVAVRIEAFEQRISAAEALAEAAAECRIVSSVAPPLPHGGDRVVLMQPDGELVIGARITLSPDGVPLAIELSLPEGAERLERSARRALAQWRFDCAGAATRHVNFDLVYRLDD